MRAVSKYLLGLAIAGFVVWLVMRGKDPGAVWSALKQASVGGLLLAIAFNLGHLVPRVLRWGALLRPVRRDIPFRPMFSAAVIGYMTTFIIPGRLGELVRPALLSGKERVPLGPSLGSIVADRLLDGIALVALFATAAFFEPLQGGAAAGGSAMRNTAIALVGITVVGLTALSIVAHFRGRLEQRLASRSGPIAWVVRIALSFARGMDALRQPRLLALTLAWSFACWLMIGLGTWIGLRACGVPLSFNSVLILLPLLALGIAIPTPGNVGGYHVVMAAALEGWFGVDGAVAVSAGLLMQYLVVMLPFILLGPLLMVVEGISWRHLMELGRQVRDLGSATPDGVPATPCAEGTTP